MKRILRKVLISILIIVLISNFILIEHTNPVYANVVTDAVGNFATGLVGVVSIVVRAPLFWIAKGLYVLASRVMDLGDAEDLSGDIGILAHYITPFHIFFNKIALLDVNYLDIRDDLNPTVLSFRTSVAGWYYTMRLLSSMILLVILSYVGIRMALSTIASEKAMYKKMLLDWTCSLALLFLLHYIMIFTFACNGALIGAMENISIDSGLIDADKMTAFMDKLGDIATSIKPNSIFLSFAAIYIYAMIVTQTLSFFFAYVTRMLTVGFLIIIAPLITITYSIDKMGDGKAQALNTWLKEFVYNILIQPFHCIMYLSFVGVTINLVTEDVEPGESTLAKALLAILCIQFVKTGEGIIRKIFGFEKASTVASMATGMALTMTAMSKAAPVGKVLGGGIAKVTNGIRNNKAVQALGKSFGEVTKGVGKFVDDRLGVTEKLAGAKAAIRSSKVGEWFSDVGGHGARALNSGWRKAAIRQIRKEKGDDDYEPDESEIQTARNKLIRSRISRFAVNATRVPLSLAADGVRYITQRDKIYGGVGALVGSVFGAAGLANGTSGMITGYNLGKGIVQGFYTNTAKTLRDDLEGAATAAVNLGDNAETFMRWAWAEGEADAFKDMRKIRQDLLKWLQDAGIGEESERNKIITQIHSEFFEDKKSFGPQNIRQVIEGSSINEEKKDDAFSRLKEYARLLAGQSEYNVMKSYITPGSGMDVSDLIPYISHISSNETEEPEEIPVEQQQREIREKEIYEKEEYWQEEKIYQNSQTVTVDGIPDGEARLNEAAFRRCFNLEREVQRFKDVFNFKETENEEEMKAQLESLRREIRNMLYLWGGATGTQKEQIATSLASHNTMGRSYTNFTDVYNELLNLDTTYKAMHRAIDISIGADEDDDEEE